MASSPWPARLAAAALVCAIGALLAALYFLQSPTHEPAVPPAAPPQAAASARGAASEPAQRYPLAAASQPVAWPTDARALDASVDAALVELFGKRAVVTTLNTDHFIHRTVATVDNLSREQAPTRLWPVVPTPGRFTVDERPDGPTLSATNARRYAGFVAFVESIDAQRAAELYRRLYPLLQAMYAELGYPKRSFNDRVVDTIDLLIETPEPRTPPKLRLVEVKGPVPSSRPWVRYEFDDPALQALPAGQRILLRMGIENEQRVKAKLSEFRELIAAPVKQ